MALKTVIIGGVAGGASTAARLRRLDEKAEIIIIECGEYISYANCGLPYYIGGTIKVRENLFVMSPQRFKDWFNIEVRVNNEALSIDRAKKEVKIMNLSTGDAYTESYDYLVLSPGAESLRPPLPGIDSPGIFSLRNIPDTDRIYNYLEEYKLHKAVVVGAGYIGLEMAENLQNRGLDVTVVELGPQVLPPVDAEMAALVQQYLRSHGMNLRLGNGVRQFHHDKNNGLRVELADGELLETDLVLLSIGVKPETKLASEAGLKVERGIKVNDYMLTSDPSIYALGDAVEITNFVTGKPAVIPLAGPANKQGRIVANNISGRKERYKGTQGTSVLKIFDMTVATTGVNERILKDAGIDYNFVIIHPNDFAGYYPGASPLSLKLLFSPEGEILGSQAVGFSGVEKRIDVIAAALRSGNTVYDLQALELAYAPPYSSAKDPVNIAGYVAANLLRGDYRTIEAAEIINMENQGIYQILDVREPEENKLGNIPGSKNIPLGKLRERLDELDPQKEVITYCSIGLRSYLALRILTLNGFKSVRNLNGGYRLYQALQKEQNS
ncbi:MAG: FAD-dependent oxidoreductase [Bacillota bacterium]